MAAILIIVIVMVLLFCVVMTGAYILYNNSFKNNVMIARQTGANSDDVIWVRDKFKVVSRDGLWIINFKKLRESTTSLDGKLWTKFIKNGFMSRALKLSDTDWKKFELSKHIQRGLFLYETSEGQLHPMIIKSDGKGKHFDVLHQDNKMFLINEIKNVNSLTKNRTKELLVLGGIVAAILVLAVVFIMGIIYLNETSKTTVIHSQMQCLDLYRQINNISAGAPVFLENAVQSLGG